MPKALFKPAWWLPNSHLQTLWPVLCRRHIKHLQVTRERFELPDGDFIDLDWVGRNSGPLVVVLHGLEGSIRSPYAQGMLQAIENQGWHGVLMHFRSCSGEHNRLPRFYHGGETSDLETVMRTLYQRNPKRPIAAVGFSLGANVLLKWLGETGEKNPLTAAIAISTPFELHKSVARISQGFSRVYQWHLLNALCKKVHSKFKHNPPHIKMPASFEFKTMYEFDDKITGPLHGFASAQDYYQKSSSRPYLRFIRKPTLLLQAKDDPFMTEDLLPMADELTPHITLELVEQGGHVGFVSGQFPWNPQYWLEERVPEFLEKYLQAAKNSKLSRNYQHSH